MLIKKCRNIRLLVIHPGINDTSRRWVAWKITTSAKQHGFMETGKQGEL